MQKKTHTLCQEEWIILYKNGLAMNLRNNKQRILTLNPDYNLKYLETNSAKTVCLCIWSWLFGINTVNKHVHLWSIYIDKY